MTLEQAIERNPFNKKQGSKSAYVRYLRYNVDGFYEKTSAEVYEILKKRGVMLNENDGRGV